MAEEKEQARGLNLLSHDDPQMQWAMEKARLTLGYFRESLAAPRPGQAGFSLKARIEEGGLVEHFWLKGPSLGKDGKWHGMIDHEPLHLKRHQYGQLVEIGEEQVTDWMVIEEGRLIGGYTLRAAREQMELPERREFDASLGITVDLGVDYFPHDMSTPEGAILCLEDAYTTGDLEAAVACKDFRKEADLMLDQQSDFSKEEDLLADMANVLELSFREHMLEIGMPSFEGVLRAFPERIQVGDDAYLITEVCDHPDGRRSMDRLLVTRLGGEWRVGPPINEEDEEEDDE